MFEENSFIDVFGSTFKSASKKLLASVALMLAGMCFGFAVNMDSSSGPHMLSHPGFGPGDLAFLPEVSIGYESAGRVFAGINLHIDVAYAENRKKIGFTTRFCPVFQIGYDFVARDFQFLRIGFLDRVYFDKYNGVGISYLYCLGVRHYAEIESNQQGESVVNKTRLANYHCVTVSYIRRIDKLNSISVDLGLRSNDMPSGSWNDHFVVRLTYSMVIPTLSDI